MKYISGILFCIGMLVFISSTASAGTISYLYSSTCGTGCVNVGLTDGDAVSGTFSFDETSLVPNSFVTGDDLTSFNFTFGDVSVTHLSAFGVAMNMNLGTTIDDIGFTFFSVANTQQPTPGDFVYFDTFSSGFASVNGYCSNSNCNSGDWADPHAVLGGTNISRISVIPLPAGIWLFGAALIGLAFLGRRRG